MLTRQNAVACDHVVDVGRVEAHSLGSRSKALPPQQILWMDAVECAIGATPGRGGSAHRVEDERVSDGRPPSSECCFAECENCVL